MQGASTKNDAFSAAQNTLDGKLYNFTLVKSNFGRVPQPEVEVN